jgi:Holliday junction DNA helicase RuvA
MIGALRGKVIALTDDYLLLEVQGVGYQVFVAGRHLSALQGSGEELFLLIHTHVREDAIQLYGFLSASEQSLFLLLTSVQGVGNKMALAILSTFTPDQLASILLTQDMHSLTQVSGIGKRIAERITTELKNKLPAIERSLHPSDMGVAGAATPAAASKKISPAANAGIVSDAISALENLGYSRADAMRAVSSAKQEGAESLSDLITEALRMMKA